MFESYFPNLKELIQKFSSSRMKLDWKENPTIAQKFRRNTEMTSILSGLGLANYLVKYWIICEHLFQLFRFSSQGASRIKILLHLVLHYHQKFTESFYGRFFVGSVVRHVSLTQHSLTSIVKVKYFFLLFVKYLFTFYLG